MVNGQAGRDAWRFARGAWGWLRAPLRALLLVLLPAGCAAAAGVAPRPPMGWNSWDAYGFTISEAQFKANAALLARWKGLGWSYAVVDEGWYMADPLAETLEARRYLLDRFGRLEPVTDRYPSAADGHGLRALGAWTHAQGLKFGIHVVRGIPKAAVDANLPIAGSRFRAADAADREALCPWDKGNYGIADNAAGQAYYDSLLKEYASWGVDFLKVDCIADHPYRPSEIRQIGRAIRKAGRPMVLSLSPGPAQVGNLAEMRASAQMWRISDDVWDGWSFPHPDPKSEFPNGVRSAFDKLAAWNPYSRAEAWADADMLPFGSLRPHPGWGAPRQSRLTAAETRTAFVLWSIARSPLILGGNLTELDGTTEQLLTNRDIIGLNQEDRTSHPVTSPGGAMDGARVWLSAPRGRAADTVAVFNILDAPLQVDTDWRALGLTAGAHSACDVLAHAALPRAERLTATVGPHDVGLFRTQPRAGRASVCAK